MASIQLYIVVFVCITETIMPLVASSCRCNGFISTEGGGECRTRFKGKLWCYINNNNDCADKKKSKTYQEQNWSYIACQDKNSSVPQCVTEDGNTCVFPFKFKEQIFNTCTKFESVNEKLWCATQVDTNKKVTTNRWGDCDMKTCIGGDDASITFSPQYTTSDDCKVASPNGNEIGCIFPFTYKNKTYNKCSMVDSAKAWCATELNQRGNIKNTGNCSQDVSSVDCFPAEFWIGIKVFHENGEGNIPCENVDDCPDYDQNTIRKILGLGKEWKPFMTCIDLRQSICTLNNGTSPACDRDYNGNPCKFDENFELAPGCNIDHNGNDCRLQKPAAGGDPLKFTTGTVGQGLLPGHVDLTKPRFNKKRKKLISGAKGGCDDPSTCRRGDNCCSIVWAGNNRQFICPYTCF